MSKLTLFILASSIPFLLQAQVVSNYTAAQSIQSISKSATGVQINNMAMNTPHLEFSPVYYENGIVYVTAQPEKSGKDKSIDEPYFELYYAELSPDRVPLEAQSFSSRINTKLHEGPVAFNSDYSRIFFTRNNILNGDVETGKNGFIKMKIFEGEKGAEDWVNIKELSFNSDEYSCIHPTLSPDENRLYFSSNMPGGYGGYDLYMTERVGEKWGTPTNLGPRINTSQHDAFPFIYQEGKLFFASQGHYSQGGYDIFMIDLKDNEPVKNIGAPFNSTADDLGFTLREDGKEGFFTSSRSEGQGKDDIYRFDSPFGIPGITADKKLDAQILVYDYLTKEPIDQAEIRIFRQAKDGMVANSDYYDTQFQTTEDKPEELLIKLNRRSVKEMKAANLWTNDSGAANTILDADQRYVVLAAKDGYVPKEALCSTIDADGSQLVMIHLNEIEEVVEVIETPPTIETILEPETVPEPTPKPSPIVIEKGSIIVLDKIFYDFGKSSIRRGAARDLDVVLGLMQKHPYMTIELSAHTDSRGDARYNRRLSRKRAESAKNYLTARGISPSRITAAGYGETRLRNDCEDGVRCSEEEHQYNRRTEIKVLEMGETITVEYTNNPPDKIDRAN